MVGWAAKMLNPYYFFFFTYSIRKSLQFIYFIGSKCMDSVIHLDVSVSISSYI